MTLKGVAFAFATASTGLRLDLGEQSLPVEGVMLGLPLRSFFSFLLFRLHWVFPLRVATARVVPGGLSAGAVVRVAAW